MKRCVLFLISLFWASFAFCQSPVRCEYWFDKNHSQRQWVDFTGSVLQSQFETEGLSTGIHTLNLHLQDSLGWCPPVSYMFLKLNTISDADTLADITYKCWIDRDYSTLHSGSVGSDIVLLDVDDVSEGIHTMSVMVERASEVSYLGNFIFLRLSDTLSSDSSTPLTYKCWFDGDYSTLQSGDVANGNILLETDTLETGLHTMSVMVERASKVSYIASYTFLKLDYVFSPDDVTSATYTCWFDNDFASAQSGEIADGNILLETAGLESGVHTVNVMVEVNGVQTNLSSYMFMKLDNALSGGVSGDALSFSYWFDRDYQNRKTGELQNGNIILETDSLPAGLHYVNIQVNNDTPSHLYRVPFYKAPPTFVVSSLTDTLQGYVEGLGEFDSLSVVQISAVANPCYEFVSWNDGNTDNPRTFTLTKDTCLTAIFESIDFSNSITAAICEGTVYTENGFNVSEAGVYTQNLQTVNGCDSTVTLTLVVNPVATTTLQAAICEGTAYTENGFNVSEAGIYTQNLQTINGCDSTVTLTLSVNPVATTNLTAAICEGTVYTENGFNVSEAGVYTQNLQTINGCDSTVTLTLTVNPVATTTLQAAICEGTAYTENNFNVSEAGVYTQNLQTINGCDSTVTLTLTVNPVATTTLQAAICEGSTYTENGFNVSEAGVYTQNLQTINGCDSTVTLTLTVNPVATTNLTAAICEGTVYTENGFNVSESGVYTQNLQTVNGCDSTVTLTLTVNPVATTTLQAAICEGTAYTENGFNVSEAGVYTQNLQTINGCDSTVTLTLTVNPVATTTLQAAICEGTAYTENGFNVSEAGVYTQNLQTINGCDSTVTLTLTVNPVATTNLTAAICEGTAYAENGFNISEAGVYTQNLQTINGCDSTVTLTLTVNPVATTTLQAAICEGTAYTENGFNVSEAGVYTQNLQTINGCDSTVTLTLTVNPVATTNLTAAICEGSTYTENGFNVSEAGVYTQNLQTVYGCDSTVTLTLTINPVATTNLTAAICEGTAYAENGFNISEAGVYTQNLQTINGCDSTVTLTLTVNPVATTTLQAAICEGTSYTENGFNVSEAGVYTQNLQTINGCDSTVTLTLTVNPVATTNLTAAICEGTVYTENGFNVSEAGVYTQNLQTINGCDSTVTLTLTVNPVATTTLQAAICEGTSYTENGFNVSEAGVYTQNLQTINGCDSTVTLTLLVNPIATTTLQAAICEGSTYTDNGFNVSEAGVYTQNLQTINGCDSIVTLTLTVNPIATTNLTAAICEGTAYAENGFNVSEAGVYTQNLQTTNGCDSTVTLTLIVNPVYNITIDATINQGDVYQENGFEVSEAGVYTQNLQTINGCDSVIVLNLTVNSSLGDVVANSIEVALYPNPAESYTVLKVQGLKKQTKVALFDLRGRKLREFDLSAGTESIRLDLRDLPSGVYTLMIGNSTKKLIVE